MPALGPSRKKRIKEHESQGQNGPAALGMPSVQTTSSCTSRVDVRRLQSLESSRGLLARLVVCVEGKQNSISSNRLAISSLA